MKLTQTIGIDLPLRVLVWQDEAGATWLSYNAPLWLVERHGAGLDAGAIVSGMAAMLEGIAKGATAATPLLDQDTRSLLVPIKRLLERNPLIRARLCLRTQE